MLERINTALGAPTGIGKRVGTCSNLCEIDKMDLFKTDIADVLPYLGIALAAYVLRLVYGRKKVPLLEGVLDGLAAIFSGMFIGSVISIYPFPNAAKVAIAGLAGFIGPDLFAGLLAITKAFKDSPDQFILKYIYAFRGVKTGMDIPTPTEKPTAKETQDQPP
jgi:hypothetical protein